MRRACAWIGWALCVCASVSVCAQDDPEDDGMIPEDGTQPERGGAGAAAEFLKSNKVKSIQLIENTSEPARHPPETRASPVDSCGHTGGVAHAWPVPGHSAPGDARVSGPENHQAAAGQSSPERAPGAGPADILGRSAGLPGPNEPGGAAAGELVEGRNWRLTKKSQEK